MSTGHADPPRWPARITRALQDRVVDVDAHLDRALHRVRDRFGWQRPRHVATYRGYADAHGAVLGGRVLADAPHGGPGMRDDWWDNLLNAYRRFETDEVPGAALRVQLGDAHADVVTDPEGYYLAHLPPTRAAGTLWEDARATLHEAADGAPLHAVQPVMRVLPDARIGVISDIDDTILQSGVTDWKTAAQLTFLHNARTRKPLLGVARLYAALQAGDDGLPRRPLFYVSSSPWNLYDLLEDFCELNAIPPGPIFLRDLGTDPGKFIKTPGHGHKLERVRELVRRAPQLRWVLLGDSGQADAELYAEAAREFGDRIAAIYIRDVDPAQQSAFDVGVDGWIERVAGTGVPMLRVADSLTIARHAAGLGLLSPAALPSIEQEVHRDLARPTLAQAAVDSVEVVPGSPRRAPDASDRRSVARETPPPTAG